MQRGITVISWDSAVAPEGRQMHLNPSSAELIGSTLVKLAADATGGEGDIAILSTTPTATNQNIWIDEIKKALPACTNSPRSSEAAGPRLTFAPVNVRQ